MIRWSVPSGKTRSRTHSMLTPASSTLGALTTSQGAGVRPAFSNSSASGGWPFDDSCIVFERERETMLTTNSSVSSMLLNVSLAGPYSPSRGPTLMQSIGGLPSVQNDKSYSGLEFQALLTESGAELKLTKS